MTSWNDQDNRMHDWCVEKAQTVVTSLALLVDQIHEGAQATGAAPAPNELPYPLRIAINDATKLLAYHTGAQWDVSHPELIVERGSAGYAQVAISYGLPPPRASGPLREDDPRAMALKTAWIFQDDNGSWGWEFEPDIHESAGGYIQLRCFPSREDAVASAAGQGFMTAPMPLDHDPRELGLLRRYVYGEAPVLSGQPAGDHSAMRIPDGEAVVLIGLDDGRPIVYYDHAPWMLDARVILSEEPPPEQDSFRIMLWNDGLPILARDPETLARLHGSLERWTFDRFDCQRPLLAPVRWAGQDFTPEQQRQVLLDAYDAARDYAANPAGWLLIAGPVGTGKTHLAGAILWAAADRGETTGYLASTLLAGATDDETRRGLSQFVELDLLVIDDLIEERGLEHLPLLVEVLQARGQRPTVLVSLTEPAALPAWFMAAARTITLPLASHRRAIRYS